MIRRMSTPERARCADRIALRGRRTGLPQVASAPATCYHGFAGRVPATNSGCQLHLAAARSGLRATRGNAAGSPGFSVAWSFCTSSTEFTGRRLIGGDHIVRLQADVVGKRAGIDARRSGRRRTP